MQPREWAYEIVLRLQRAHHVALWAGGCVRDSLLERQPKDYDVATSATPDEVQQLFGHKRTLSIGKSFGVITVLGSKSAGPIEVATFRRDGGYSDGRRPDSVEFTDAKEDALRRDFTINGIFFDPIKEQVIDYVGGQADIDRQLIRAIGDANKRIEEDKLRMLRGVRFAATYGFRIESRTMEAIRQRAAEIHAVSPERIGNELRRMLSHANKSAAFELLLASELWQQILPDRMLAVDWKSKTKLLKHLASTCFATSLATILPAEFDALDTIQDRWRLTNQERDRVRWILKNINMLSRAASLQWSQLQPLLISPHADSALSVMIARCDAGDEAGLSASIDVCQKRLAMPPDQLDPPPLVDGRALHELGLDPGPEFKQILNEVRALQLDGALNSSQDAITWVSARKDR